MIGPKTDEESFHKVSQEIGVHESDILFLSDNPIGNSTELTNSSSHYDLFFL